MKKIFLLIENAAWNLRCRYSFWLHGPYGLARQVESMPFRHRINYLRKFGATVGDRCIIDSGFTVHRPDPVKPFKNLVIGNDVYIGHNILLDLTDKIVFEDNSAMGANCQVWTHVGDYLSDQHDKNDYEENIAPVVVRAGAVCYSGVLLNPGIIVGKRSRVFAMSMVSSDVPENEIWAGVPAKKLMEREGKITLRK